MKRLPKWGSKSKKRTMFRTANFTRKPSPPRRIACSDLPTNPEALFRIDVNSDCESTTEVQQRTTVKSPPLVYNTDIHIVGYPIYPTVTSYEGSNYEDTVDVSWEVIEEFNNAGEGIMDPLNMGIGMQPGPDIGNTSTEIPRENMMPTYDISALPFDTDITTMPAANGAFGDILSLPGIEENPLGFPLLPAPLITGDYFMDDIPIFSNPLSYDPRD